VGSDGTAVDTDAKETPSRLQGAKANLGAIPT
jgi:hypothetical protein